MTRYILLIILFSGLVLSCKKYKQEKEIEIEPAKIEKQISRYCFVNDIKDENQKSVLLIDLIEQKSDNSNSQLKIIELPNGVYFTNIEKKIEAIEIDSNSILTMQTFSFNDDGNFKFNEKVVLTDFMNLFTDSINNRFKNIPFRIVSTGTKIDSLFEIYIP